MKIAALISRILLGLVFVVFGLNGFLHFIPQPPPAGDAGTYLAVIFKSHYYVVIFALQIIGGAFLLIGRFVPLGLALLAPIILNIITFHATLAPQGLPVAAVVTLLWLIAFFAYRKYFSSLFVADATPS